MEHTTGVVARRTVLAGAAWSVPVIALAVATPAAAASRVITVDFAAAYIELPRETDVLAIIAITGPGSGTVVADSITIVLEGLQTATPAEFEFGFDDTLVGRHPIGDGSNATADVDNRNFDLVPGPPDGTITITGSGVTLFPTPIFVGIFLSWPAENPEVDGFIVGGSFTVTLPGESTPRRFSDNLELQSPVG
jgi:hypothetical protein